MFKALGAILICAMLAQPADSILPEEYEIAEGSVECAVGFSSLGAKMFTICGDARGVTPTPEQIISIRGGVFTHSHVGECPTLSYGDMDSGARSGLRQMRAVSHLNGKVVVASVTSPKVIPAQVFQDALEKTQGTLCARIDQVWRTLAPRYGFEYSTS